MSEIDDAFFKAGTSFDRPMPGQSLTDDPATPRPFEQPPTYTKKEEVLEYYFEVLTQENTYQTILEALLSDVPIMDVVKSLLFRDFQEGMFNPDMMLLVAEPLAYMIAALAERADVDFTIMGDPDEYPSMEKGNLEMLNESLKSAEEPPEDFPEEIQEKIETVEPPKKASLLGEK